MRQFRGLPSFIALMLLALGAELWPVSGALAQEATPVVAPDTGEAITVQIEAFAPVASLPQPGVLGITRATLAPGAVLPLDPSDPSLGFFLVEAGTITVRQDEPMGVIRAGTVFAPGTPIQQERIAADTEVTLTAGDAVISPPNVTGEVRNDGNVPAVLLVTSVIPTGETTTGGTPTP